MWTSPRNPSHPPLDRRQPSRGATPRLLVFGVARDHGGRFPLTGLLDLGGAAPDRSHVLGGANEGRVWEQRNSVMRAYYAADKAVVGARNSLPDDIRHGPIIMVTTSSGVTGDCRSEVDIRRLYDDELQRHPRFTMEAWSDDLKAAKERCRQLEPDITTDEYREANRKFHRLHDDHNIEISREIREHRNGANAELQREQERCDEARERAGIPELETKVEALGDEWSELDRRIGGIEASGVAGLAIQAKLLRECVDAGSMADDCDLALAVGQIVRFGDE